MTIYDMEPLFKNRDKEFITSLENEWVQDIQEHVEEISFNSSDRNRNE